MPLRMDSSWLAVRCSSLTEAAPSKAPSSISDTLLLLRLLGEDYGVQDPFPASSSHARGALPPTGTTPHPEFPLPILTGVLTAPSRQRVTHIFFRWVSFLNIPVASRMEISLLFNRL